MSRTAYTIGNEHSYDLSLADTENPPSKIGVQPDWDPPYPGGCLWRLPEEAQAFIETSGDTLGFHAAVYELLLPTGWDEDASSEISPDGTYHHLLHTARIVRKIHMDIRCDCDDCWQERVNNAPEHLKKMAIAGAELAKHRNPKFKQAHCCKGSATPSNRV